MSARKSMIIGSAITVMLSLSARGETIFVDKLAAGEKSGKNWKDAFTDLQAAIQSSRAGDEIWVAEGSYFAATDGDRSRAFVISVGVSIFGGFAGDEHSRNQRDLVAHVSMLSADINAPGRHRDNTQRLVEIVDVREPVVLDGFVLRDTHNERDAPLGRGGAVYVVRGAVTFANCEFHRNRAGGGGAMWIEDSVVTVENCFIRNNRNRAITSTVLSDVTFRDCRFVRNKVSTDGGAIGAFSGSVTTAANCEFLRNAAVGRDGGAYYGRADGYFANCRFVGNTADEWGGALRQWSGPLTVINCSFMDNRTRFWAGGVSALFECTISGSVFHGNVGDRRQGEDAQFDFFETPPVINNCLVEGWTGRWGGEGNFDAEPKWIGAANGNLRLAHDSPCIDAGTDDAVTEQYDLDGNPRILGARVDIGAYENVCREVLDFTAETRDNGQGECDIAATVSVNPATLPPGSTVRVAFAPADGEPKIRKARIQPDGTGTATLRAAAGAWTVCVEGCGEPLCREAECP